MFKKIRKFIKDNDEAVFLTVATTVMTAATIAVVVWSTKQYNTEVAEYEASKQALREFSARNAAEGRATYLLADGGYIAVRPQDIFS